MSSSPTEDIEGVSDDESNSSEDATEIDYHIINMEIDQSSRIHDVFKCILKGNYVAPLQKDIKRCLELGYSSGILMMELASEFEDCEFYGLDRKPNAPNDTYPRNCHFEKHDFYCGIPYPDEHFDYVYLRCTMVYVREDKYNYLLGELNRVLKKGGWIEFTEIDIEYRPLGPICKSMEEIWCCKMREDNADVERIRQLGSILTENGFINVKEQTYDIPLGDHGGQIGINMANFWSDWAQIHKNYIISKLGDKSPQEYDEYIANGLKEFDEHHSSTKAYDFIAQKD